MFSTQVVNTLKVLLKRKLFLVSQFPMNEGQITENN